MSTYYVYISEESVYPVVVYADHYIRNKESGYCSFLDSEGHIIVSFSHNIVCDIIKIGD